MSKDWYPNGQNFIDGPNGEIAVNGVDSAWNPRGGGGSSMRSCGGGDDDDYTESGSKTKPRTVQPQWVKDRTIYDGKGGWIRLKDTDGSLDIYCRNGFDFAPTKTAIETLHQALEGYLKDWKLKNPKLGKVSEKDYGA